MNLLFGLDDNYAEYCAVTLKSFLENNPEEHHDIYIAFVDDHLNEQNQAFLRKVIKSYDAAIYYYNLKGDFLNGFPVGNWAIEIWLRLYAIRFLPHSIDRILYLDADIVIINTIKDFYMQNLDGYYFAGCEDVAVGKNDREKAIVGLDHSDIYINSGVLMINLREMRERIDLNRMTSWVEERKNEFHYPTQTALNTLFHDEIKICDAFIYNCQIGSYSYKREKDILQNSCILHFVGSRPWNVKYRRRLCSAVSGKVWWKYAVQCGFKFKMKYIRWKFFNFFCAEWWNIGYRILKGRS